MNAIEKAIEVLQGCLDHPGADDAIAGLRAEIAAAQPAPASSVEIDGFKTLESGGVETAQPAEPLAWECLAGGLKKLTEAQYAAQTESIKRHYSRIQPAEPVASPTAGMNIALRILHVGGRDNAAGYIEFGSIQAVEALVNQVLRDLPPAQREPLTLRADLTELAGVCFEAGVRHGQGAKNGWFSDGKAMAIINRIVSNP